MPEVLTYAESDAYLRCRQAWYDKDVPGSRSHAPDERFPQLVPYTYAGDCNVFKCVLFLVCSFVLLFF